MEKVHRAGYVGWGLMLPCLGKGRTLPQIATCPPTQKLSESHPLGSLWKRYITKAQLIKSLVIALTSSPQRPPWRWGRD